MTALTYNFPAAKRVFCANPVCQEPATFIVHTADLADPAVGTHTPTCTTHLINTVGTLNKYRLEKLIVPGQYNAREEPKPDAEKAE